MNLELLIQHLIEIQDSLEAGDTEKATEGLDFVIGELRIQQSRAAEQLLKTFQEAE